ncbi:hypothetical protein G8O24_38425 [Bradyrhizobium sp. INPA01-394B]|uniref:Transposase n=1 Tax=Bradyrhizobium campsiandrae TaxID=1729892 RepID=A0ABR7ULZ7_9BRAD|nr:hypothetical protein [Bradyrhizobium campsiandrae]MBC9883171.1 hypothetical protein [Bradyrhizobium campsiandrae]MBC9984178.1 hypothetical protein [Bradyrhizobium campsiandrae]
MRPLTGWAKHEHDRIIAGGPGRGRAAIRTDVSGIRLRKTRYQVQQPWPKSIKKFKPMQPAGHIAMVLLNRPMRALKNIIAIGQSLAAAT